MNAPNKMPSWTSAVRLMCLYAASVWGCAAVRGNFIALAVTIYGAVLDACQAASLVLAFVPCEPAFRIRSSAMGRSSGVG